VRLPDKQLPLEASNTNRYPGNTPRNTAPLKIKEVLTPVWWLDHTGYRPGKCLKWRHSLLLLLLVHWSTSCTL